MAPVAKKGVRRRKESRNRPKAPSKTLWLRRPLWWGAAFSLLLILSGAGYLWQKGGRTVTVPDVELEVEPITARQASLSGKITHIQPLQIGKLVDQYGTAGLLALDPEQLREAMEAIPWVYRARVRKVWPDRLELWVEEQRPAAIWGERGYLNLDGAYYEADGVVLSPQQLPIIQSTQEDTVAVYRQLQRLSDILARQQRPAEVASIELDRRGAVSLTLRDGLVIHLGRRAVEKRLRRWITQSEVVLSRFEGRVAGVDLRYERGMVLQLKSAKKVKVK